MKRPALPLPPVPVAAIPIGVHVGSLGPGDELRLDPATKAKLWAGVPGRRH